MASFVKLLSTNLLFTIWMTIQIQEAYGDRWFYRKSCHCNYTKILNELPQFLQDLSKNENFNEIFQGKKGERGAVGPPGPIGLPGRNGKDGLKGERGEPGPSIPDTSLVFNPKGSVLGSEREGKGRTEARGPPGRKGQKGEPGTTFTTLLQKGSYIQVKGEKGDRGSRARKGQKGERGDRGIPGLSIEGEKGEKGDAAILPHADLLRGPQGPPGLPGPPGKACGERHDSKDEQGKSCGFPQIVLQKKGEKGDPGHPGLAITGDKGDAGPPGPPGRPGTLPKNYIRSYLFASESEMRLKTHLIVGTIGFITTQDRAYIKVSTGWKEIQLGALLPMEDVEPPNTISRNSQEPGNSVHYSFEDEEDQYYPFSKRKIFFAEAAPSAKIDKFERDKFNKTRRS